MTDETPRRRTDRSNPVGIAIGSTLGPFSAAVGSVVSENRFAFKLAVGAGANDDADDGFDEDNAATIDIQNADEETLEETEDGAESSNDDPTEADD
ncbi:hypothetical protein KY092_12835 [Natronomonas gomsonensis]|uniref:hypothetical protein n=1 Tax=Natronomonas gomsonensis TaxID=1046043 RepID=UPI0020CA9AA0|nr:hypothetical protein [Natronomonas gomsonensis]MCY4731438.1 hypothetical protein [Natronomonas gomsonensis]